MLNNVQGLIGFCRSVCGDVFYYTLNVGWAWGWRSWLFIGAVILKSAPSSWMNWACPCLLFYTFAAFMLSTQLNYMAEENKLAPNCICVLKKHVTNILKDGRYALFLYISHLCIKILLPVCVIVLIIVSIFMNSLPKLSAYKAIFSSLWWCLIADGW